jgi:TatD DNase family protein
MSALPELIDSHCHLNYDYAPKSVDDLVRDAHAAGIAWMITVGTDIDAIEPIARISETHERVFHTVGVHPHEAVSWVEGHGQRIREAARHPKCRAIGEIGLDTHYEHSSLEDQKRSLEAQLSIALELALPVVIHSRDAESELLEALTRYARQVPEGRIPGVIHCFTGTRAFGEACIALGFYVSFSGILTFKNAQDLRECAKAFPLERLLVETDSPYLAPIPHRGRKCEPSYVRLTAEKLAEVKGLSLDEVARATSANARKVFKLPD